MTLRYALVVGLVTAGCLAAMSATAQPRRDPNPRIGQISDEVALQRLRVEGFDNPRILRREGTNIIMQGDRQGSQTTLRLDALQGRLFDTATPDQALGGPGAQMSSPMVSGLQVGIPRAALSEPNLMRDAIQPQR